MVICVRNLILPLSRSIITNFTSVRQMSAIVKTDFVKSLLYKEYGDPVDVLHVTTQSIDQPENNQVIQLK